MATLDFILIGVQKGGTTSLWRLLKSHPGIAMPNVKEAPLFFLAPERIPETLERAIEMAVSDCPGATAVGKAATPYMMGLGETPVEVAVERMAEFVPDAKLIALLRDPIDRAVSHYRMSVRRGFETRSLDCAVEELLAPEGLDAGRARPTETNSYLAQGEYARIMRLYRERFAADQIHVELTAELEQRPDAVLDRVLPFLGIAAGYRPEGLGKRNHVSGAHPRLDREGLVQLSEYMAEHVWPKLGEEANRAKIEFSSFLHVWNVLPDDRVPALSPESRRRLEEHYRPDGERLTEQFGIAAPWLRSWTG